MVFVTAFAEHAVEAFAGGAVHYLLKPVSVSRRRPEEVRRMLGV